MEFFFLCPVILEVLGFKESCELLLKLFIELKFQTRNYGHIQYGAL